MWYDVFFKKNQNLLLEAQDEFKRFHPKRSYKDIVSRAGEGMEELQPVSGYGLYGKNEVKSFNLFYNSYIDFQLKNEREKIKNYRTMARMPEIGEVLEDVVTESTQTDFEGKKLKLIIRDSEISNNDNISKMLQKEFEILFHDRMKINKILDELFMTYYIDGRVYWENIIDINNPDSGIIGIKKLPTETMDFVYNVITGKVEFYVQYLREGNIQLPPSIDQAKNTKDLICFFPEQISYIDYGQYGANKKDVFGYLEKVKAPYNQVKLLESAVVIYRLVRAPERLVFTIDVGNLPREKAMKLVEKIKLKMQRKETYDTSTGNTTNQPDVMALLENYFLPTSCIIPETSISLLDGRELPMKDVIDEYNSGKELWVYSIDNKNKKMIPGKIKWAGYTRKNAELVRVYLDNGEYIDCTPDHKFILRNGEEVEAQNLEKNSALSSKDSQINVLKVEKLDHKKDTCCLTISDPGENHNFALTAGVFIKNSDGRGSSVSSIGGNPSGFTELDDLYYFHRKMYRALKYPLSRVDSIQEKQSRDDLYQKTSSGEITRDEVKWGRFLKYHQDKFSEAFLDLFLLHLNLKGIKKEFNIKRSKLYCEMTVPNNFISQMNQLEQETRWSNYNSSNSEEFSKYWRMKKYLKLTDEEILANSTGFKKDQELGFAPTEEQY